jgi:hypothetical protein
MPKYTNRHGLPDPLFQLLGRESYSRGASRRSATQLIDSPRLVALKEKHHAQSDIEVDVSERIWALFGTAVHKLIEDGLPHSSWHLTEERIFAEVNGWKISGAVDLQEFQDKTCSLVDWKVCSIWSLKNGWKPEWENQLNLLAYLVEREKGRRVVQLQIGALIRDWSRADSKRDPKYPPTPFHMVDIPLWSFGDREAYVLERVRLHQEAEIAVSTGDEPEPCTDEEMWLRDEQWAVYRQPTNKRASKVFDAEADALAFLKSTPGFDKGVIQHRAGERLRCSAYCDAAPFCTLAPKVELEDGGF